MQGLWVVSDFDPIWTLLWVHDCPKELTLEISVITNIFILTLDFLGQGATDYFGLC